MSPDDNEFSTIVEESANLGGSSAFAYADANPDEGARARKLSDASGVGPLTVFTNTKEFDQRYKASMASYIVRNNPDLQTFTASHPLAPVIANDDWGHLDMFGRQTKKTAAVFEDLKNNAWLTGDFGGSSAVQEGFKGGFGAEPLGSWAERDPFFQDLPRTAKAFETWGLVPEIALRGMTSAFSGATALAGEVARQAYTDVTGDEMEGERFGRDISALTEQRMIQDVGRMPEWAERSRFVKDIQAWKEAPPEVRKALEGSEDFFTSPEGAQSFRTASEAYSAGKQWIENGLQVPQGVHPLFDQAYEIGNAYGVKKLIEDLNMAQDSAMKNRDPGMFNSLVEQYHENSQIGISGDFVARLYEGKEPQPEDGILGWVPDIEAKLAVAREIGDDVRIPVKDYLSYMDPRIAQEMVPYTRVFPHGITADEAAAKAVGGIVADTSEAQISGGVAPDYRPVIDAPLPAARFSMATEPMFSIGDRKLQLQRIVEAKAEPVEETPGGWDSTDTPGGHPDSHEFNLLDHKGNIVGALSAETGDGGKKLLIRNISGKNGFGVRDFGPSLIADLLRQLKVEFPNMEELLGYRVTGARRKAGTTRMVSVKLDAPPLEQVARFRDALEGGEWQAFHPVVEGYVKPKYDANSIAIADAVREEFNKLVPKGADIGFVQSLRAHGREVEGVHIPRRGMNAAILLALDSGDVPGVMRHEAIHALRPLFEDKEWMRLERAARDGGWLDRFDIHGRYSDLDMPAKLEEAIAEAYKTWEAGKADVGPQLHPIFQKIKEFLDRIRQRINDILGRPGTVDDIFDRVSGGEVGARPEKVPEWEREDPAMNVAANDSDAFQRENRTYGTSIVDQVLRRFDPKSVDIRDSLAWAKFARENNIINSLTKNPNAFNAAKQASLDGKTTVLVMSDSKRRVYHNGEEIARDRMADVGPKFSVGPDKPSYTDVLDKIRADATGLTIDNYKKVQDAIHKRYPEDLAKAQARAEKEIKNEQTKTWRADKAEVKKEVETALRARPDIAADLFFSSGDLFGRKVPEGYRIASDTLSEAQKEALPRNYYAKKGLPVDGLAKLFGFTSGDGMVESLVKYRASRGEGTAQEALGKLVREETDRQMEAKHRKGEDNLMAEAKDRAVSETDFNLLAEEMYAAASIAKQPLVIDKAMAVQSAQNRMKVMPVGAINVDRLRALMKKAGDDAFNSILNGDPTAALVSKQKQVLLAAYVREAAALEKELPKFQDSMKRLAKVEQPNVDPQYRNLIHLFQQKIGVKVNRLPENIAEDILARDKGGVTEFLAHQNSMLYENPVPGFLLDNGWNKTVDKMTLEEFKAVNDAFTALAHNGRELLKVTVAGDNYKLGTFVNSIVQNIKTVFPNAIPADALAEKGLKYEARVHAAGLLKIEALFNRWDIYNKSGPLQKVLREVISGFDSEVASAKKYARIFRDKIDDKADLEKAIDNPLGLGDPRVKGSKWPMNVGMRRAIMLNLGTNSKYFANWKVNPGDVEAWILQTATKEDWEWAQKVSKLIWEKTKDQSGTMYRSLTGGVAPEYLPSRKFKTKYGEYELGYYPVIFHGEITGKGKQSLGDIHGILDKDYFKSTNPPAGYTIGRVGSDRPLSLDLNDMGLRLRQVIHDIEMRPSLIQAGKIFFNKQVQDAIALHIGPEYKNLLEPYLRDVANASNYKSEWESVAGKWSEFARQNAVFTLVGLNPNTLVKHSLTALGQSFNEVGGKRFVAATFDLLKTNEETGQSNWDFAKDKSQLLQRRMQNAQETLYGSVKAMSLRKQNQFMSMREWIMEMSSYPVGFSDLLSAVPTWLAEYRRAKEDGMSEGESIALGDRAVRFAHGDYATTNRPAVMRGGAFSQWMTSVYNFYSHMLQKSMEIYWRARDAKQLRNFGDIDKAREISKPIAGMTFAYVFWPAVVGTFAAWVAGEISEEDDTTAGAFARQLVHHTAGNVPLVRDVVDGVMHKKDPQAGLLSTYYTLLNNFQRDIRKEDPLSDEHAGRLIQDLSGTIGATLGLMPQQVGKWGRAIYDIHTGQQQSDFWPQLMHGHERKP